MSSFYYFKTLNHDNWQVQRDISNAVVASTITLRTPVSGKRVTMSNVVISSPIGGSIAFYYQGANQLEKKILEIRGLATSATIVPAITNLECTAVDTPLLVRVSIGATDAWSLTAEGFELD